MRTAAAFFAALALAGTADAADGTLHGTVRRGPTQPVCRAGSPCTAPAAHETLLFRHAELVVRTRTDAHGRYRIGLAAGVWTVALPRTGLGSSIEPSAVRVVAGRSRVVDLSIDTGIR